MTQNNKCKVSPSIVNNSQSGDVRVEMEMDAQEIIDQLSQDRKCGCLKPSKKMNVVGLISYCILAGLILFMSFILPRLNELPEGFRQETIMTAKPLPVKVH